MAEIDDVLDCILDIQGFAVIFQLFVKPFVFCGLTLIPSAFSSHRISFLRVWQSRAWPGGWQDALAVVVIALCGLEWCGPPG